jgi:hypothetical protein
MLIHRDIYEITADQTPIQGAKVRGRIRKFAIEHNQNCLTENDQHNEKIVRFAIPTGESADNIKDYIISIIPDAHITLMNKNIANPVLSKLNINDCNRY